MDYTLSKKLEDLCEVSKRWFNIEPVHILSEGHVITVINIADEDIIRMIFTRGDKEVTVTINPESYTIYRYPIIIRFSGKIGWSIDGTQVAEATALTEVRSWNRT
jgi:hypothetical protein